MKKKTSDLFYGCIMLFPIATLFQSKLEQINKILFACLVLFFLAILIKRIRKDRFPLFIAILFVCVVTIFNTNGIAYNTNEYYYYPFAMVYLIFMTDNIDEVKEYILNSKGYITSILNIWTICVFVSLFLPSSYNSVWGDGRYFGSFCQSIFRFGPTGIFISGLAVCAMIVYDERRYFYYSILPLFTILMGGSRTYMLVELCAFMVAWYYFVDSKKNFYLSLIPVTVALFAILVNSSMMDKFNSVSYTENSYFDYWGTITSGRSIFWAADIEHFRNAPFLEKVFGSGFNCVYDVNQKAFGGKVWAHNDFIQCLVSHGILGLVIYITIVWQLLKSIRKKEAVPFICLVFLWLFNAFFNMFYTYFCSVLCLPLYVCALQYGKRRFDSDEELNAERVQSEEKYHV